MKKLRTKVFLTIFSILTIFLITVSVFFNTQNYLREVRNIEENLNIMERDDKRFDKEDILDIELPEMIDKRNPKMFMDVVIYTIYLDEDNNITDIISHNEDNSSTKVVEEEANKIIKYNDSNRKYVGNLYIDRYSYKYEANNTIILIDNYEVRESLRTNLFISLIICIVLEILIVLISKILTKWIIQPVEESFSKQKQFIQDASHELKTPIAVIMASSEAFESSKDPKWIESIKDESIRMSKLTKSLLDLAKLEDSNNKINYVETNLSKLVEKQVLTLESLMYENNIKLETDIDKDIKLLCDPDNVKQLVAILTDNAIKHSSIDGEIIVRLKNSKGINLEVINKGDPIPKGTEEKIFERFYRAEEARNRDSNRYGLGLAIAKSIVSNHNGEISASSCNGYTTFKVIFKK